jgi:hypothetical protein
MEEGNVWEFYRDSLYFFLFPANIFACSYTPNTLIIPNISTTGKIPVKNTPPSTTIA